VKSAFSANCPIFCTMNTSREKFLLEPGPILSKISFVQHFCVDPPIANVIEIGLVVWEVNRLDGQIDMTSFCALCTNAYYVSVKVAVAFCFIQISTCRNYRLSSKTYGSKYIATFVLITAHKKPSFI